jgi:hypothetical protein
VVRVPVTRCQAWVGLTVLLTMLPRPRIGSVVRGTRGTHGACQPGQHQLRSVSLHAHQATRRSPAVIGLIVLLTVSATGRSGESLLATSLLGDVVAALREDGSATLDDEHCCYFRRPD